MTDIDWSKAPKGATHCLAGRHCPWYQLDTDGAWLFWTGFVWGVAVVTKEEKAAMVARHRSWNGEGVPPAGTICEVSCCATSKNLEWTEAKLMYSSSCTVVLQMEGKAGEFIAHPCTMKFRLIKTPEQIAKDEREAALKEIVHLIESADSRDKTIAEAIYDAGYRKQAKEEE